MRDPLTLYRFALRIGDRPLAEALARRLRGHPGLCGQADLEPRRLPRGRAAPSARAERAVRAVLRRIGALLL